MVEKMKRYSFLIYYKTYNEFLESIRQAGVVHIVEKQKGIPDDAADLRKALATADSYKNTIYAFEGRIAEKKNITIAPLDKSIDGMVILREYEQLKEQEALLKSQKSVLQKEIDSMTVWGDFDPAILRKLEQSGHLLQFYSCREREFKPEWADKFDAIEITRIGTTIYFVTLTPVTVKDEPDAEKVRLSDRSLTLLQVALQENKIQAEELKKLLDRMAVEHLNNLKEARRCLLENIDLNKVHLQVEKKVDDKLILLEGWAPEIKESELVKALDSHDVYYTGYAPEKDDKTAPILLKNNRFSRLFELIGELYDLPNYHELDLTPFFAPFYMLFFGLCLGDAGYGLLILIGALVARRKMKPSLKPIFTLAAILGIATVICGAIGGTLFGIALLDQNWAWLTSFKQYMINSDQLFTLALILGGVQIIFGMIVKACGKIRRYGFVHSLETWGWIILIVGGGGLYLASTKSLFSPDIQLYAYYAVFAVSGILIFFFNSPGRNPLVNFGSGLWNSYNMLTGVLGDLLSYIRLFALGICSGVMGFVFNDLAVQLSGNIPVVSQLAMLLILLAGHSLNIFMSALGSFVHPMRLTFVEFYKNAGFEGGGVKYKPLKFIPNEE